MAEIQPNEKTNKFEVILSFVLIAICVIAVVYLVMPIFTKQGTTERQYTTTYTNVSAQAAYDLINNTFNLTIIDCRTGCPCRGYNLGHIPDAIGDFSASDYYNRSNDILVCGGTDSNGGYTPGEEFCQKLINHVYGKVYNLEGGIDAWKEAGYPVNVGTSP